MTSVDRGLPALDKGKAKLEAGKIELAEGKSEYEKAHDNLFMVFMDNLFNRGKGFEDGRILKQAEWFFYRGKCLLSGRHSAILNAHFVHQVALHDLRISARQQSFIANRAGRYGRFYAAWISRFGDFPIQFAACLMTPHNDEKIESKFQAKPI